MATLGESNNFMIDEVYEFSAPRYFDFMQGETKEEMKRAELWFQTSLSHAPSLSVNHGTSDDDFTTANMILSGVPLDDPCVQHRLSNLAILERKGLRQGKLPISDSFFLMGTADPTGLLNRDEVCVILDNGQISGKVLVYRYPGLHFGDVHVLNAVYSREMEDLVGNAKYGIFFSTKGPRSVSNEIANGDFDGDMYWVSKNNQWNFQIHGQFSCCKICSQAFKKMGFAYITVYFSPHNFDG